MIMSWLILFCRTVRVDIQAATTSVTRKHSQFVWLAVFHQVSENTFYTLLMELVVFTERHQIAQQLLTIDLWHLGSEFQRSPSLAGW